MPTDLSELERQSQKALVDFLRAELKLAYTFREISQGTRDSNHRAKLLENVRKAASTIRHFEGRITDKAERQALNEAVEELEALLSADKNQ
jgi:hypothetical protein